MTERTDAIRSGCLGQGKVRTKRGIAKLPGFTIDSPPRGMITY